ncbi:MAG TPA: hypothetical protein VKP30_14970, partial [Polyangiaceae bacterium]|nr:hypothetical protein [Polyangiaceae bacterium]
MSPPPDLIKYKNSETAPLADRINVFGNVLAVVKIMQMDFASALAPNSREKRRDSLKCSNAFIVDVHPRNIVGMIRLCKRLKADYGIAAVYTAGFLRWVKGSSNYAWDSHGRGRAFDLSGVAQQMPNLPPKDGKTVTQPVRPGVDFVVYFHWGLVKMQVLTTNTASGTSTQVAERHRDTGKDYSTSSASSGQLLYRLDPIPDVADRAVEFDAPRVDGESTADHLARSEDWSNDHYGACRDV